ncbi:MAG: hypothetical protein KAT35_06220 [Candidatus Aenigmarchaeota archaeon]|nr:hypothetical protein [Candidatus Aenigmarchaeota archaeon]
MVEFDFDAKREEKLKSELRRILGPGVEKAFKGRRALFADGKITEVFLVDKTVEKTVGSMKSNPYSAGLFAAKVVGKKVRPSLQLLHNIDFQNVVVVGPKAEQRFLYGKHLTSRDVIWSSGLLGGETVVVCNESDETLGYGRALTNSDIMKRLGKEEVVRNLDDLGWYLRHGG